MGRISESIKGGWYPPRSEKNKKNRIRNTEKHTRNKQKNSKQYELQWNWNRKMNQSIVNLIRKTLRRNNRVSLQPSLGSTLPKSIESNTSLLINLNKMYEKNKKMTHNKDSGHGESSLGKQRAKDTGN